MIPQRDTIEKNACTNTVVANTLRLGGSYKSSLSKQFPNKNLP